ncbi:MaoC/PaaZ C-terminal domain-containing protein [Nocardia sp. BMG111209]|uniref:MaoC/PaaZ C-terminal domain-containing protein n=1 Tax=Nocardia sp. BMG111209 TaxID=1160137 RepID=UPI0003604372|nr:MaoC/PaaZ C-terminal domain-containing protein [Nocardia sp. BMG111209]
MPINETLATTTPPRLETFGWRSDDVLLYHLALGAGSAPTDPAELAYVTEPDLRVLPSFAVAARSLHEAGPPDLDWPGIEADLSQYLHGSQRIDLHAPIPAAATGAIAETRVAAVYDKGKAALVCLETTARTATGTPLWTETSRLFIRGEGGFGGERGPSQDIAIPDRAPDAVRTVATLPQQALWYRLLGDRNPLHSDPVAAEAAGFPRPILHGLCTYGIALKAALRILLDDDTAAVRGYDAKFTGVVFPGESLHLSGWRDGDRIVLTATVADRDDAPALLAELTVGAVA